MTRDEFDEKIYYWFNNWPTDEPPDESENNLAGYPSYEAFESHESLFRFLRKLFGTLYDRT